MDEVTRAYLQSVVRGGGVGDATRVPCRGRWRVASQLPALGLAPEHEPAKDEQHGEEVALPDGLVPLADRRVRIVARPGMGKTTLLLALHARLARAALAGESAAVPVFVELRYWSGSLGALVGSALREHGWELTDKEATRLAGAGALVLLLDGLNELPDKPAHEKLDRWLRTHPRAAVVMTTRLSGETLGDPRVLELIPLSDAEISAAATAYLGAHGEAMLAALAAPGREALWEMARTPLLLTMLCSGYGELAAVPRNPAELLRHGLWQQRGNDEQTRAAMGYLAHASVVDAPTMQLVLKRPRVEELLGRFLQTRGEPESKAAELCDRLLRKHLLAEPRPLALVFPHQLVQEFYVAEHLLAIRSVLLSDRPRLSRAYLARSCFVEPLTLLLGLLPLGVEGRRQALALVHEAVGLDDLLAATLIRGMRDEWQVEALPWIDRAELGPSLRAALLCVTQAPAAVARLAALWGEVDGYCRWEILDTLARIATPEAADFAARLLAEPAELVENDQTELAKAAEVVLQARAVQRHGPALIAALRRIAAVPQAFGAGALVRAVGQLADAAAAEALLTVSLAQGRLLVEHWDELACPLDQAMLARVCALADPQEVGEELGSCIFAYVDARGPIDVGPVWDAIGPGHRRMFLVRSPHEYAIPAACVRPLLARGELLSDALRWVARTGEASLSDAVCGLCDRLSTRPNWEHVQVGRALAAIGDDACVDRLQAIVRGDGEKHCREDALRGLVRATRPRGTKPPWTEMPERGLGLRRLWTSETPETRWGVAAHRAAEAEVLCRELLADDALADAAGELLVHAWPEPINVVRVAEAECDAVGPLGAIVGYVGWRAEVGTAAELAALVSEPAIEAAVVRALAYREVGIPAVAAARLIPRPALTEALFDAFAHRDPWFGWDGHGRKEALREALLERGDPALGVRLLAAAFTANYMPRPGLAEAFALLGERWLDALVDACSGATRSEVIDLCSQRGEQLKEASPAARTRLARMLLAELPRDGTAWKTCELLASLSDIVAVDEVVAWLADWQSQELHASPVVVLRAFAVADEQLLCWLEHPSAALRMGAATVLHERADRRQLEHLIGLLAVPEAAPFAARALKVPGWVEALPALSELASTVRIKETDVYTAAIAAIGGPAAAAVLFRLARVQRPGAALLLQSLPAEDRMVASAAHLEDPEPAARVLALDLLEETTSLAERVRALLVDPDPSVVRAAVRALRYQEAPGLAAELWRLRARAESPLVEVIDRTLATLPDAETWPLVLPGLRAGDVAVAGLAEELYPWYDEPPLDAATLVELLASPVIEVRWFAVDRLWPTVEHAEAMLAAVPATRDDGETYIPELRLVMDEPIEATRRTADLRGKVLHAMARVAEDSGRPEAERAWMAQRLALHGSLGNVGTAMKVLLGLSSGPAVLRELVDDPRRGKSCLEQLFHRNVPSAREVLREVLRTGTPQQRRLVLARAPSAASAEDLPWIREELERWIVHGEVDPAQSLWGGPLAAIQRVGTLADVRLLYRVARTTRQGAWAFGALAAIGQLQGRLERIAELPEPTPHTRNEAPQVALARMLAEIHAKPVRLRQFLEQVESQLVLELGWDRGVLPIARELVEHLDRHGLPEGFFDTLEALAPDRAEEIAALRGRWESRRVGGLRVGHRSGSVTESGTKPGRSR